MKLKFLCLMVIFVLIFFNFIGIAQTNDIIDGQIKKAYNLENLEEVNVRVAILKNEKPFDELLGYEWVAGNKNYKLDIEILSDKDLLRGKLRKDSFDAIVVPGGEVGDAESSIRCFPTLRNFIWKRNFKRFIEEGGGCYGVCGGTALVTDLDLDRRPKSFLEYAFDKSSIGITRVKSHYKNVAQAFFGELGGLPPEYVGVSAYFLYMGWATGDARPPYSPYGTCLDCKVNNEHPIFDDFLEEERRVNYIGGPSISIPEEYTDEVDILLNYPEEEMSENKSTRMYAWEYKGGVKELLKGFIRGIKNGYPLSFYWFAEGWKLTDTLIETDFSNDPAMISEIYPNENEARIVLTGLHPEFGVWWGGEIEKQDLNPLNLYYGLYRWKNITLFNETPQDELSYNSWINRRSVAWTSKVVPDNDLPPTYGPSQVCDIYPFNQTSSEFKIFGISDLDGDMISLDLFYRFSNNNDDWGDWIYYSTDEDISDGCSWDFNSPNGTGYYQFYSIRHVRYEYEWLNETAPTGPDAVIRVCG